MPLMVAFFVRFAKRISSKIFDVSRQIGLNVGDFPPYPLFMDCREADRKLELLPRGFKFYGLTIECVPYICAATGQAV